MRTSKLQTIEVNIPCRFHTASNNTPAASIVNKTEVRRTHREKEITSIFYGCRVASYAWVCSETLISFLGCSLHMGV